MVLHKTLEGVDNVSPLMQIELSAASPQRTARSSRKTAHTYRHPHQYTGVSDGHDSLLVSHQ